MERKAMTTDHETNVAMLKVLAAWAGLFFGGITLSDLVLAATLIFTVLQIIVMIRKLWKGQA